MATTLYKETQRYHDWFVIALLLMAVVGLLYGAVTYFSSNQPDPIYSIICLLLAGGLGYAIWWLIRLRSKLTVTNKNIKFKIKGGVKISTKIAWEDIESCELVRAPKIARWDRPKATLTDEKYYSLSGRQGLMITTQEGKHYFIGCQNLQQLRDALNRQEHIYEVVQ